MMLARIAIAIVVVTFASDGLAAWKILHRDTMVQLSVDPESIHREGSVATFRYLVDFRLLQGEGHTQYRSQISYAKVDCKARTMALTHTDAYFRYGGEGLVVAKTKLSPADSAFRPLEKGSSDEDLWGFVCQGKAPPVARLPAPPPPIPQKQK